MNAFIAEDDIVTRHLLQTLLTRWGYTIIAAEDGAQALQMLPTLDPPVLVLLDWMMPGASGTEVCRQLRKLFSPQDAYVIMLTALNQAEDVIEGLESGVDDYLCKPMTPVELRARLQVGARILSIETDLINARKSLAYEITRDELTGLLNRESILKVLASNIDQSLQENVPLAMAIVQIDSRCARSLSLEVESLMIGGAADALIGAAHGAIDSIRAYDAVGRFGTNEFLVVFPGVGRAGAMNLAMRLLAGLTRQRGLIPFSANIGIASSDGASDATAENLVQAASQALREATAQGPNRIEFASVSSGLILPSYPVEAGIQN